MGARRRLRYFKNVVGGPSGFVGWSISSSVLWFSTDGLSWEVATAPSGGLDTMDFGSIIAVADGFWAVGRVSPDHQVADQPVGRVWRSTDGRTWTLTGQFDDVVQLATPGIAALGESILVWALDPPEPGWGNPAAAYWVSHDGGVTLTKIDRATIGDWTQGFNATCVIDGRSVLFGYDSVDGIDYSLRASSDMTTFAPVPVAPMPDPASQPAAGGRWSCGGEGVDARFAAEHSGSIAVFDHTPDGWVPFDDPTLRGMSHAGLVVDGTHQYLLGNRNGTHDDYLWTREGRGPFTQIDLHPLFEGQGRQSPLALAAANRRIVLATLTDSGDTVIYAADLPPR